MFVRLKLRRELILNKYDQEIISNIKVIWDYLVLNQDYEPSDVILGCGCFNTDIPVYCAELFKNGYGRKILFSGGLGKITQQYFNKSEAEVYRDIAIDAGISADDILLETKSTNTGDNFLFSKDILMMLDAHKVLIVHKPYSERRTLSTAKASIPDIQFFITSPPLTFEEYLTWMQSDWELFQNQVSLMVGDVQRCMIYPEFGWMQKEEVPLDVMDAYSFLKEQGFEDYVYSPQKILKMKKQNDTRQ